MPPAVDRVPPKQEVRGHQQRRVPPPALVERGSPAGLATTEYGELGGGDLRLKARRARLPMWCACRPAMRPSAWRRLDPAALARRR